MTEKRIAVFASGEGTNARRLMELSRRGELAGGRVALLVSDKPGCGAVASARESGVPVFAFSVRDAGGMAAWERRAADALREEGVGLLVLAGFMRIVGPTLLSLYEGRIINVHPSLLPEFKGLDAVGQALSAGVGETGVTVHWVDANLDSGPILLQRRVPILPGDSRESLLARIHAAEHEALPEAVRLLCSARDSAQDVGLRDFRPFPEGP